ncbi:MAG: hypothetical protein O2999_00665 [Nitrospirae bacterium]|nr:hypothetical protein [Nitrospirota bacterium]MDA1302816.1 hypothetical protein [Nitrospirota bacterium]
MTEDTQRPVVPPWLYKLFTGNQYPYIRRLAKFEKKDRIIGDPSSEPTREEIDAKFWEIYPQCSAKVMQEVKVGMIVAFKDLGAYPPGGYQELADTPDEFLAREYGRKKIKVNFYYVENFVCTINFKVAGWVTHDDD